MKRRMTALLALLLVLCLCLAGCGSKDESPTATETEPPAAETEAPAAATEPDALYINDGTVEGHYQTYEIVGISLAEYAKLVEMSLREAAKLIEFELREDGSARFAAEGEWADVTFRMDGDAVEIEAEGEMVSGILKDGLLTLDFGGTEVVLARLTDKAFEEPPEIDHGEGQSWYGLYTKFVGDDEPMEEEFELLLYDDGTGVHFRDGLEIDVVWERDGSDITMQENTLGMTIDYVGTITEDELHLFNGDPEDDWTCEYVYTLGGGVTEDTPAPAEPDTPAEADTPAPAGAASGDGYVSEETLLKTYVWLSEVVTNMFDLTYEDIAEHFGVEGLFDKEEYSEHMQVNKRYYYWISEEDELDFIYFNFEENEDGSYTLSSYNTNHFSGSDAVERYLDEVKAEAAEADREAAANMEMTTITRDIYRAGTGPDSTSKLGNTGPVTVQLDMPASGWSYNEDKDQLVDNDDPSAWGAGFIQFEVYRDMASVDFYKDSYEDLQEIGERDIGGITFQGRTYKNIGYEWEEYVAEMPDGRGFSIGIVRLDTSDGTVASRILDSIRFQ